jgi:hypothetical protein
MIAAPCQDWNGFKQIFAEHWDGFKHVHQRYHKGVYHATLPGAVVHRERRSVMEFRVTGLEGKVVVIAGGARGMGAAYVRGFLAEGARVVATDLT